MVSATMFFARVVGRRFVESGSVALLFGGLGSQYYGMAEDLFDGDPVFSRHVERIESEIFRIAGVSAIDFIKGRKEKRGERFTSLLSSSVTIFAVQLALAEAIMDYGIRPKILASASYGFLAAATLSEAISLGNAVRFMVGLASIVSEHGERGHMLAILGNHADFSDSALVEGGVDVAGVVSNSVFSIAVPRARLQAALTGLERGGLVWDELPIEYPFHTRWIDATEKPLRGMFSEFPYVDPKIPIIYSEGTERPARPSSDTFWNIVRSPTRLDFTFRELRSAGVEHFVDLSPGGGLAVSLRRDYPRSSGVSVHPVVMPFRGAGRRLPELLPGLFP